MYFSDEETANMVDPIFSAVEPSRCQTLVATLVKDEGLPTYEFDIHMQGTQETVFFNP
jgi:protocatechuate 3,4-dioxygenase alpha subunit